MQFFTAEESFGSVLPRLILFFPWATALSLGGIGVLLVSLLEERRMWRALGVVGGVIGVVLSFSRIGLLMCIVCLTVLWWTGSSRLARWTAIAATWVALSIVLFSGVDLMALAAEMLGAAYEARSGASLGRQLIYERSWEGFLTSPIFGHGSIGGSILATEVLPIGSHSSVVGLLYTGGLVTFVVFSIALTMTLLATGQAALRGGRPERVAFALVVALVGYAPVESLFSFSLPCLFVFFWIGAALPVAVVHTDGRFPSGGAPVVGDARA
jgi:O-antigen ligase